MYRLLDLREAISNIVDHHHHIIESNSKSYVVMYAIPTKSIKYGGRVELHHLLLTKEMNQT